MPDNIASWVGVKYYFLHNSDTWCWVAFKDDTVEMAYCMGDSFWTDNECFGEWDSLEITAVMKMNNADKPAAPIALYQHVNEDGSFANRGASGLTKREHFAGLAMQELLTHGNSDADECASYAVEYANALLKALKGEDE